MRKPVAEMTDEALLAEYNRQAPKYAGTNKQSRKRAMRSCKVRDELAKRGLVESFEAMCKQIQKGIE